MATEQKIPKWNTYSIVRWRACQGKDGRDGKDGKDGRDGRDGKDFASIDLLKVLASFIKAYITVSN